jgi:hypothetical protein
LFHLNRCLFIILINFFIILALTCHCYIFLQYFCTVKKSLLLAFVFIVNNVLAQLPYQFSKAIAGGGITGVAVTADVAGNVYTTGLFSGTMDADPSANTTTLTSNGGNDIYVIKLDANGNFLWAFNIGGSNDEKMFDITADASGVYLAGNFSGTTDFNPSATTNSITYLGGGTDGDGFFAKYDANGNYIFAKRLGSAANDRCLSIAVNANNNIFVSGFVGGNADMDPGAGTVTFTVPATYNAYFAKFDSMGNYIFAKQIVGNGSDANDLSLDASGNILMTGSYWSTTNDFNPGMGTANLTASSTSTIGSYLAKYDANGNYIFAKKMSGSGLAYIDIGLQIKADANNNIIVAGTFNNTCDFDPSTTATASKTSAGGSDLFIAKYDSLGNYLWVNTTGGSGTNDYVYGMAIDANNNIYATGRFNGTNIDFDPSAATAPLTSSGNTVYVASYDATGAYRFAYTPGAITSVANCLAIVGNSLYITGQFSTTADFNFDTGTTNNITATNASDMYIAKYFVSGFALPIRKISATNYGSFNIVMWQIENPCDVSEYQVYRISENEDTLNIATVLSTCGTNEFNFKDNHPLYGNNNYSIKSILNNGDFEWSQWANCIYINNQYKTDATFVHDGNYIKITYQQLLNGQAQLYNLNGNIVAATNLNSSPVRLSTANIPAGMYLLKIFSTAETKVFKIIIF